MTDEDYAMKFYLVDFVNWKIVSEQDEYADKMKYVFEAYNMMLKHHQHVVFRDTCVYTQKREYKERIPLLRQICKNQGLHLVERSMDIGQLAMFRILVAAISRTLTLVRFYAPEGELLSDMLKATYCTARTQTGTQICEQLHISRATLYRRRPDALRYAGYLFFEAVLPDMEDMKM